MSAATDSNSVSTSPERDLTPLFCPQSIAVSKVAEVRSGECTLCCECTAACPEPDTLQLVVKGVGR